MRPARCLLLHWQAVLPGCSHRIESRLKGREVGLSLRWQFFHARLSNLTTAWGNKELLDFRYEIAVTPARGRILCNIPTPRLSHLTGVDLSTRGWDNVPHASSDHHSRVLVRSP